MINGNVEAPVCPLLPFQGFWCPTEYQKFFRKQLISLISVESTDYLELELELVGRVSRGLQMLAGDL